MKKNKSNLNSNSGHKEESHARIHHGVKKSLGQHFLKARGIVREIVSAGEIKKGEMVLEIGPGKGILTEALISAGAEVIAVEKDKSLFSLLKEKFADEVKNGQLTLLNADVLDFDFKCYKLHVTSYKLVANIPYYITGEILRKFIGGKAKPSRAVLLVQKEVAERIVARPKPLDSALGKESILSISVKIYGSPKYLGKVPAKYFSPAPKVDSAILLIENISSPFNREVEEKKFFKAVKKGFSHKRKMLLGNLKTEFAEKSLGEAFQTCGLDKKIRAENLTLENWKCLCSKLEVES